MTDIELGELRYDRDILRIGIIQTVSGINTEPILCCMFGRAHDARQLRPPAGAGNA